MYKRVVLQEKKFLLYRLAGINFILKNPALRALKNEKIYYKIKDCLSIYHRLASR